MALIDKETIRTRIEWRIRSIESCPFIEAEVGAYDKRDGKLMAYRDLLAFLDSIQEQPVIKKSNALFDECVKNCDPAVMKEVSDNIDKMLGRQPASDGLEEAAHNFAIHYDNGTCDGIVQDGFIAGAKWQKAKMMKEAVEGEVYLYRSYKREATAILVDIPKDKLSDKVRIIVIKEDK